MIFKNFQKSLLILTLILLQKNISFSQQLKDFSINESNCNCTSQNEKPKKYVPPLNLLLSYEKFTESSEWKIKQSLDGFNKLYFDKLYSSSSQYSGTELSMTIISSEAIKIDHPNKDFTINLTPCFNADNFYDTDIYFTYQKPNNFGFKNFDHSAKSYFNLMLRIRKYNDIEQALKTFWVKKYEYNGDSLLTLITNLNLDYELKINPELIIDDYEGFIENLDEKINEILKNLNDNEIDLYEFTLSKYILSDSTNHKMNNKEESNIALFFHDYQSENFSVNWINENFLSEKYSGVLNLKKIAIEVNSSIIKNKESTEKTSILLGISKLPFSNKESININTKDVCQESYEIANTGIMIALKDVNLMTAYPKEIAKNKSNTNHFSGLLINKAIIQIPHRKSKIEAIGNSFKLNNKSISGSFEILKINTLLSKAQLEKHLSKLGLNKVVIIEDETLFTVTFNNIQNS